MKMSLALPTWKCPERETALKWHRTTAEETSASTEQYQYPTCLPWQSLPDQFKRNTSLLKRFRSRTISIKHVPSVQTLVLQPQSWWALGGGDQPGWLWSPSASPAAGCPSARLRWQHNLSKNEARNNSTVVRKRPRRLTDTAGQVSRRLSSAISNELLGAAQPGNVCLLRSTRVSWSKTALEKKFLSHLRKINL